MLALYIACRLHTTHLSSSIQCLNQVNSGLCIVRMYADEPDECPLRLLSSCLVCRVTGGIKEPLFQFPLPLIFTMQVFLISMTVFHSPICQLYTTTKNNGIDDLFFKHCRFIYTQVK